MGIISSGNTVIDNGAIDANEVDTTQIANDAVTADKIATGAVGADQLAPTGISAGPYTLTDLTVDADGRINAIASGSAGGGGFFPKLVAGSGSGTVTSNGNKMYAFAMSGGGGGGGHAGTNPSFPGGNGAFGVFTANITPPFSQPYSVGSGGAGGNSPQNGQAGGATNLTNVFSINGGQGGGRWAPSPGGGNPGSVASGTSLYTTTDARKTMMFSYQGSWRGSGPANAVPYQDAQQTSQWMVGGLGTYNTGSGQAGSPGGIFLFDNES